MASEEIHIGFAGLPWQVHKFGGTSVASAECFLVVARILEEELGLSTDPEMLPTPTTTRLVVVVSAMGGKPKVTDLLLDTVKSASERDEETVQATLQHILEKHTACLDTLFENEQGEQERLLSIIRTDISDIRDILKTVSLMKWHAQRISELVAGYGELWSAQILTALMRMRSRQRVERQLERSSSSLHETPAVQSHEFVYLDARRVITVDEEAIQNGAIVWDTSETNLKEVFEKEVESIENPESRLLHFIVTGYVASNTDGVATTLQRDGSDYSASIMGRLFQANNISIWTDVDGVLSADPRRVPHAQVLPEVSYNEAMELAYFGAKVMHPKTMQPAILADPQIPIYIRNTFNSAFRGTRIYINSTTQTDSDKVICGFSTIEDIAIINVEGSGLVGVPGVAKRMFGTLERIGVNVVLIAQASSEHSVTFATAENQAMAAKEAIEEEFHRELQQNRISNVDVQAPCSIIAAVGDGMAMTTGASGRFFSALGDVKINVLAIAQGFSERNISAVVKTEESTRALRAVHAAFRLSHTTVRVCVIGMNELGKSLLELLDSQRSTLRSTFDLDLQVCAVLASGDSSEVVRLRDDHSGDTSSITITSFNKATGGDLPSSSKRHTTFRDENDAAICSAGGISTLMEHLFRSDCTNHVLFDCSNDESVGMLHAEWLRAGVDVVTANNTGLSGPKEQRDDICAAEKAHGKQSAKYLREVTVGGGLPVINTLRKLLHTGDKIRRIDGILSVSLSFIMFRISPPPDITLCSDFDEIMSKGAFQGDLSMSPVGTACSFSQAVKEAVALGLMEEDPTKDLNNEYTARVLMVLTHELGMLDGIETSDIQKASDKLPDLFVEGKVDYHDLSHFDTHVQERVDAAKSRGCVLRHISSIEVKEHKVEIKIVEVPEHHIFAVTPPSCECVRMFTHRHQRYPLIIQGPSSGVDSTASALLAELLHLMRGKASPHRVALTRSGSAAVVRPFAQGSNA